MSYLKMKSLLVSGVVLVALSLTTFAHGPIATLNNPNIVAPQDTAKTATPKPRAKQRTTNANQNNTTPGSDLNNSGSPAQVRHERTGSLNPYSTGTVKSHEGTSGATGPSGK